MRPLMKCLFTGLCMLATLNLTNCSDEETFNNCQLTEYKAGENNFYTVTFTYDAQNRITVSNQNSGGTSITCTYSYAGNEVSISCTDGNSYVYVFNNNRLEEVKTTIPGSALVGLTTFEYLADQVYVTINRPWGIFAVTTFSYFYDDKRENFVKQRRIEGTEPGEVFEDDLTYSTALNPFQHIMFPGSIDISRFGSKNLLVDEGSTTKKNQLGLPISVRVNGNVNFSFKYACQ